MAKLAWVVGTVLGLLVTRNVARADVTVDRGTKYQTFDGWEATDYAAQGNPAFASFRDAVMAMAVNELGITRIRLEVRAGVENATDYYQQFRNGVIDNATWQGRRYTNVNDDADPNTLVAAGFHFTELDEHVDTVVLPLKAAVEAAGEQLQINLCYVAFTGQNAASTAYIHDQADEYGELVAATYQHLETTYGLVPDYWEMILEPDTTTQWTGMVLGRALVTAGQRITALGHTPRLIAPSNTNMTAARDFFDVLASVPGALDHLEVLSYHRYGGTGASVAQDMANRAQTYGIKTAMLEWIGASVQQLHEDLKIAGNSAWQQFTLASAGASDDGDAYLRVDASNPASPVVTLGSRSKLLRQYMKFIRPGAVRIAATSDDGAFDPVAFINRNTTDVVVVKANAGGSFAVHGLAAGTYNVVYTTDSVAAIDAGDTTIDQGEPVNVSIPASGVVTVWGRPPPSPPSGVDAGAGTDAGGAIGGGTGGASMMADGGAGTGGTAATPGQGPMGAGGATAGGMPPSNAPGTGAAGTAAGGGNAEAGSCGCHAIGAPRAHASRFWLLALLALAGLRRARDQR